MKQRNEIDIHNEFCRVVQNAKEEYYREVYDAPELDINKLVKSRRKRTIKRIGQIAAVFLVFVISSVFFAQEFLSDTGYGKYIVQKSVSSLSPLDIKTERLGNGEPLSVVYIDDESQLNEFNKFMGREVVLNYMPEEYSFKCCNGHKASDFFTVLYRYEADNLYMDIDVEDIDYNVKTHIRGKLIKTMQNGDKIYGENPDKGTYTVTRIINDDIFIIIDGDGDYNEAIKVAENVEVK